MKKIDELTPDENKALITDISAGVIRRQDLTTDTWIESNPATALDTLIEVERSKRDGKDMNVLFIGQARQILDMRPVVVSMVAGERESENYFELNSFGIWEHIGENQYKIHVPINWHYDDK